MQSDPTQAATLPSATDLAHDLKKAPRPPAGRPWAAIEARRDWKAGGSLAGPPAHWLALGLALCAGFAIAAVILRAPYPPLQDFIEWIYQADILTRLPVGGAPPGVELAHYPVPNSLFQMLLGGLALTMPAPLAGKVFLVIYAAAAPTLAWALARRYQPEAVLAVTGILLVTFCFNTPFWNGYFNYQTGLLLFMAWFLIPEQPRRSPVLILCFSLALFFAHAICFAAFAMLVSVEAVAARRIWTTTLALLPLAVFAVWYVLAKVPPDPPDQSGSVPWLLFKVYTLAKLGPYHNFVFETGGDAAVRPALYWAGAGLNLLYVAGLFTTLGCGIWIAYCRRALSVAPLAAATLMGVLFLALPQRVDAVINPGERLVYPGLLLLLLYLTLPRWPARLLASAVLVLATSVGTLTLGPQPWWVSVSPAGPRALNSATQLLFWHRPTAFACKWQQMQRAPDRQDALQVPITFRTSLLVGDTHQECDPDWKKRGASH